MVKAEIPAAELARHVALARPRAPVLVTSLNPDGTINVAPFSWNTPISVEPPLFLLALQERPRQSDTLRNLENGGQFVTNFPGLDLARQLVASSYEHAPGVNKFSAAGFTPLPSRVVRVPGIAECRAHLECDVIEVLRPAGGDHALVVGRVVAACYDPSAWTEDGAPRLEPVPPVVHLGQRRDEGGQTHLFLRPAGVMEVFVPYVERR